MDVQLFKRMEKQLQFVSSLSGILANPRKKTISVLLIDESYSMKGQESAILKAVNSHLESSKKPTDGSDQYVLVITFNDEFRTAVPLSSALNVAKMTKYVPDGNTLLYETVYLTIKSFFPAYKLLRGEMRFNTKIVFGIFTDGDDNESDKAFPDKLKRLVQDTLRFGFDYYTLGFKHDAKRMARLMGMPADDMHAQTHNKNEEGIINATMFFTSQSIGYFDHEKFDPSTQL